MYLCVVCPQGHPVAIAAAKLGSDVACPQCFTTFHAALEMDGRHHARKEESRSRRSRDDEDDDDDDEEERPKKKAKSRQRDDDDDDDEKPRSKKRASKDEDEDEDEDDDEEEEDEEEEIVWTSRKRQLNICSIGVLILQISTYFLAFFYFFAGLAVAINEILEWTDVAWFFFYILSIPLLFLNIAANMICLFMNLAIPSKAEARGPLIGALVFHGALVLIMILLLLTWGGVLMSDPQRAERMSYLLGGLFVLCFFVGLISIMAYLSKLMIFMRQHLQSSQPVTNAGFVVLFSVLCMIIVSLSPWLKDFIGGWMCFVVAFSVDLISGWAIRILIQHGALLNRLRSGIADYIRDA